MSVNKNASGSIMIAALIVALITGTLVGFFLKTVTQEINYAHRARMAFQATNLAEAGIDQAIYAMNKKNWMYWESGPDGYYRDSMKRLENDDWLHVSYSFRNEKRHIRMYIEPNPAPSAEPPKVIAEGIITLPGGATVSKQVYAELGNRSLWANGLLAKDYVTFNGQGIMIDSYSSDPSINGGIYDNTLNRNDEGTVASVSVFPDIISAGNADIFGRVATGGDYENPNPPHVGPNGSIRGLLDPDKTVDTERIAYDFEAYLPDPNYPSLSSPETTITGSTLGSTDTTTYYNLASLNIAPNEEIDVEGHVVILVTGDVDIGGTLDLETGASIEFHVVGDFEVIGPKAAIVNPAGRPQDVMIFGLGKDDPSTTVDETPQIKLAGNGSFYGAVYAPNYDVNLDGSGSSGEMFGAVVAGTITFAGGYQFHYDETLAGYESDLALKVTRWAELTEPGERRNMNTILQDGL